MSRPGVPPAGDTAAADDAEPRDEEFERRTLQVDAQAHGQRLDHALVRLAPEFSRSHLQSLVARGHVHIDDRPCAVPARRLRAGQRVDLELVPTAESLAFRPEAMVLDIVHEDDAVLVLDKPAGLVVHPAAGHWSGTLLNGLLAHHAAAAGLPRAGIVHRLDKDTSGLMVVAKTLPAMTALVRAIAARDVQRRYRALVHGDPGAGQRRIDAPMARDPASRLRMAVVPGGKPAQTDVRRVGLRDAIAAVECTLHTGRTHQIRVHLAHRGHPLLADALYGGAPALGMLRQALHAWRLAFAHPLTAAPLAFERLPPPDLLQAWRQVAGT